MTPDVLIVGAGPAGSTAALILARAGVRVRLLDRARFPRPKLCGDTLNPGAMAFLAMLDRDAPRERARLCDRVRERSRPIDGMTVSGPGGEHVAAAYPPGVRGATVERRDFDLLLLEEAVAAGAECEEGVTVLGPVIDAGGRVTAVRVPGRSRCSARSVAIPAPVIIAADGRGSRLASSLGLARFAASPQRWAFGAYYSGVQGLSGHGEMHIRGGGYIGIAALPGGAANVCVVRQVPRGHGPVRAAGVVEGVVRHDPMLRDRFRDARPVSPVTTLGPLAMDARRAGCPGLLLAGDAAGFVDPMTGDGIRFALRGGALAAEAALRELRTGRPAWSSLEAARRREFGRKWRVNRALRYVAGSPRVLALVASLAGWWAQPVRYLVRVAGDVDLAWPEPELS